MNDREKWLHANGGYDLVDRRIPRRLGLPDYLLVVARIEPARVRKVPSRAVVDDGHDDDGAFAFVDCPCGAKPIVRADLGKCSGCERYYVLVGSGSVFLTYGAMTPPPLSTNV
jgi:hypothetical protein